MRHQKLIHAPLQLEFKSSLTKEWTAVAGFRNVAKALRWVKSTRLDQSADEILLTSPFSKQIFLFSPDQECFREIV